MKRAEMSMRQAGTARVLAVLVGLTMLLPQLAFAGDETQWGSTPGQTYTREVPALQDNKTEGPGEVPPPSVVPPAQQPTTDSWQNTSPISLPDGRLDGIPQGLTEEESAAVLVRINELINLALDSMRAQRNSLEQSGEVSEALKAEIQKYEAARVLLEAFLEAKDGSVPPSQDGGSKTGGTTASEILKRIDGILGQGSTDTQNTQNPSLTPSENLIRRFSSYALASVQGIRERMKEDSLLPAAKIFSAEESPETTREDHPILSREAGQTAQKDYQVLGSVVLNRETARVYELLNPSPKLHPFLRWLFYGRHLTQVRAERYLAARAKVREICMRAKAGEGLIRYKGKIMESFLPLPGDESGGTFELVRRM